MGKHVVEGNTMAVSLYLMIGMVAGAATAIMYAKYGGATGLDLLVRVLLVFMTATVSWPLAIVFVTIMYFLKQNMKEVIEEERDV